MMWTLLSVATTMSCTTSIPQPTLKTLLLSLMTRSINSQGFQLAIEMGSFEPSVFRNLGHAAAHDDHLMLKVGLLK